MTNTPSPDEDRELVTILSSVCGAHFDDACQSCQSAKESNDRRLESLLSDRAKLEDQLYAAFMAGWLTGHHGNEPVDAWPVYLDALNRSTDHTP